MSIEKKMNTNDVSDLFSYDDMKRCAEFWNKGSIDKKHFDQYLNEFNEATIPIMWVITFAINAYDQEGDYFERVFDKKPTVKDLDKLGYDGKHLINGGGRKGNEGIWYYLTEIKSGEEYEHSR